MTDTELTVENAKAEILPFESWEMLKDESSPAFTAFIVYRDLKTGRSIKKAVDSIEQNEKARNKCYGTWRSWAVKFRWRERAADYDRHIADLNQTELRKNIEAQGQKYREVTGLMLDVVKRKLTTMNSDDLTQNNLAVWIETAAKTDKEIIELLAPNAKIESRQGTSFQGEFNFVTEFQGL